MRHHMIMGKSRELVKHGRFSMKVANRLLAIVSKYLEGEVQLFVLSRNQRKHRKRSLFSCTDRIEVMVIWIDGHAKYVTI